MSYLHDDLEDDTRSNAAYNAQHRELTLSTGTILGIFLGLALLCAVFFGFGYSMGTRAHQAPTVVSESTPEPGTFNNFSKPNAGAPASTPTPQATTTTAITPPAASHAAETVTKPAASPPAAEAAPIVRVPVAAATATPAKPDTPPTRGPSPANEAGLTFVVQVAAVSHQEDADMLTNGLRRKGYNVSTRTEPQDKLFHIQIGPFASKKDAEAMRQRLQTDGYNALIK